MPDARPDPVAAFAARFEADRQAGAVVSLDEYLRLFPGDPEGIARGYLQRIDATTEAGNDPTSIGPYRVVGELGRGGQGVVYLAEHKTLGRRVALKVLQGLGAQREEIVARFRREALVASALHHPGICTVYEAGLDSNTPYIAMQSVEGETLAQRISHATAPAGPTSFNLDFDAGTAADGARTATEPLDRRAILDLVRIVERAARALHAAHEVGVVHRDIKPGNLMITPDGNPVILDFGLARQEGVGLATLTQSGDLMGTPAYMSPEQLERDASHLDRRTDVWSLGVCLYEAVMLVRPFEAPTRHGLYQAILTTDPIDPSRANRAVPGDLGVVLLTALEKNRDRRYQSALAFAEDLARVLRKEPILARPVSRGQRFARWAARNPAVASLGAAVFVALTAGLVVALVLLASVAEERDRADTAARAETAAKLEAEKKRTEAEASLGYAKKGNAILTSVFANLDPNQHLTAADLRQAMGQNLGQAAAELEGSAIGDQLEVAAMQKLLAQSLLYLGDHRTALAILEKAVETGRQRRGVDDRETLETRMLLASALEAAGRLDEAATLAEDNLRRVEAVFGLRDEQRVRAADALGLVYRLLQRRDEAIANFRIAVNGSTALIGADHPTTLRYRHHLAAGYLTAGRFDDARAAYEELLPRLRATLGPTHTKTLECVNNLANTLKALGRPALPLLEEAAEAARTRLGPDHPNTLVATNNLAAELTATEPERAAGILSGTLPKMRTMLGAEHPNTLSCLGNLGVALQACGRAAEAVPLQEEVLRIRRATAGAEAPATLTAMNSLASAYMAAGKPEAGLPLLEEALKMMRATLGNDEPNTILAMNNLAGLHAGQRNREAAAELYDAATEALERRGFRLQHAERILNNAIGFHLENGEPGKAEHWSRKLVEVVAEQAGPESSESATAHLRLGLILRDLGRFDEAEESVRKGLAIRERREPENPMTFSARSLLGGILLAKGDPVAAEPLLLSGYEGMKARAKALPAQAHSRLVDALDRLIELYRRTDRADEAARLAGEREQLAPTRQ